MLPFLKKKLTKKSYHTDIFKKHKTEYYLTEISTFCNINHSSCFYDVSLMGIFPAFSQIFISYSTLGSMEHIIALKPFSHIVLFMLHIIFKNVVGASICLMFPFQNTDSKYPMYSLNTFLFVK